METIEISPRVRAFLGAPLPSLAKATVLELLAARRYVTVLLMCTEPCDEKLQALYHLQRYRELEEESENMSTAQARLYHAIAPFLNGNQLESMSRLEKLVQCPEFATSTKLEEACSWLSKVSVALGVPERMESGSAAVMGRHYLALGDVDRADTLLTDSRDKAMVLVARKDYQKAIGLFRDVNVRELDAQSQVGVANNLAVCLLYCQEVDDAVKVLENLVRAHPFRNLLPCVVKNLLQLYEFLHDGADRKGILQELILACLFEDPAMPSM
eukprot:GEMP01049114.1.p1 GENE.GEMP01049114.1~~GEMP01049114.1.p1  ORF type:complete len:270 (+),score=64.83 GEMP01049114.1:94-903(+)